MPSKSDAGRIAYLSGAPRISTRPDAEEGGARSHVLGTISGFRQCGWAVETFIVGDQVPRDWVAPGSYAKKQGGVLKRMLVDIIRLFMRFKSKINAGRKISGDVSLVYERYACMQSLGSFFQRSGVPWILETNGLFFLEFSKDRSSLFFVRLARFLELLAYRRCDALVCISDNLKKVIVQEFGISESKIIVLPNGVDTNFFEPLKIPENRSGGPLHIGFVGTFVDWHALDVLLEAIYELNARAVEIRLTLVGSGPELDNLRHRVSELALGNLVSFSGRLSRDNIPAAITEFDIGYSGHIPTKSGEMYMSPLKIYEYMAMAKPVIASRNADSDELVAEGETGYVFEAGDKESIKAAIIRAVNNKGSIDAMGRKARIIIEEKHSWKSRVEKLLGELDRLIPNKISNYQ